MKTILRSVTATCAIALAGTLFVVGRASAGCPMPEGSAGASFKPASLMRFTDEAGDDFGATWLNASYEQFHTAAIVGLWKVSFTARGNKDIPDGAPIDQGYATWHDDGTELMNSGRPPITSSFCMGVWKQIGPTTYKLNHVALSWDPTGTVFVGPASIREIVTVDRSGNHYSGTFTIVQFSTDETTVLARVTGTIGATRITAD